MSVALKVILKKVMPNLGRIGEVVHVKKGYAFNFLLPNNFAVIATKDNIEINNKESLEIEQENKQNEANAKKIASEIAGKVLYISRNINDTGSLYAVINREEVANVLNNEFSDIYFKFEPQHIIIHEKIKSYGIFDITLSLYYGISTQVKLVVSLSRISGENLLKSLSANEEKENIS